MDTDRGLRGVDTLLAMNDDDDLPSVISQLLLTNESARLCRVLSAA